MTDPTASIRDAYDNAFNARRKIWIGGIPTEADLAALRKHIAARLRVTPQAVAEALHPDAAEVPRG